MIILDAQAGRAAGCVLPAFCLPPYRVESSRGESSPASGILWPAGQSVPRRTHAGRRGKTGRTLMLLASDANAGAPQRGLVSGACICICIRDGGCAVRHACRAIEYKGAGTPPSDAGALHATPPIPPIPFGACVRRSGRGHKYPSVPHQIRTQQDAMRTTAQPNAQKRLETIHNLDNAAMRSVALHTRRTGDEQPNPR